MSEKPCVLRFAELTEQNVHSLLDQYGLNIAIQDKDEPVTGSFWGDEEAGLVGNTLYIRPDTPVHSILHEACHYVCMDSARRSDLDTNAGGDYDEENAVCYLQILLAEALTSGGAERLMQDMDAWGYTFRLGSAKAWFTRDAQDASDWLKQHKLIDESERVTFRLR